MMIRIKFVFILSFFLFTSFLLISKIKAENQVVIDGQGANQLEQSGTGTRFETGSVNPMWGGTGDYTFQTYFIDPQGRDPEFVKIYLTRGGDKEFASFMMTKGMVNNNRTQYSFKKNISEKNDGIYQFYFEAKIGGKLIHGPSYGGDGCKPGGCGECCGVWGGPKILASKLIEDNKIYLFEKEKTNPVVSYDVGKNWLTSVDISSDEKYFAAADNQQNLYLFDISAKALKWKYTGDPVVDSGNLGMDKGLAAFSNNGYLAASLKGVVFLFDIKTKEPIWSYPTGAVLNGLAISEDGQYIAAAGRDTYVYLWKKENSDPVWKYKIEAKGGMMGGSVIKSLSMTPKGDYFVAGTSCPDRSLHVFSPQTSKPIFSAKVGINFPVESIGITDNGQSIFAGGGGSREEPYTAVLYKLKQDKPIWVFDTSLNPVNEVAVSGDGKYCAIGSILEGIYFNKCTDKKPVWQIKNTGYIGNLSFSEDGQYLAAGTGTNHVLLVSTSQEKIINDWKTSGKAEASKVSSSGRFVAVGTGLNRFFIISAEGVNSSGADARETKEQKIELVKGSFKTSSVSNSEGIFAKIKSWFANLFNSIFPKKGESQKTTTEKCGNGLCEPDLGEKKESCPKDCTQ